MEINNTEPNPRECILECLQSQVCALTHGEKLLAEGYKSDAFVSRRVVVHNPWEPRTYDGGFSTYDGRLWFFSLERFLFSHPLRVFARVFPGLIVTTGKTRWESIGESLYLSNINIKWYF